MGKVFFSVSMSLDGCIAPEGMDLAHFEDPGFNDWLAQWMELQRWALGQRFLRERLKLGDGGETGADNERLAHTFARTGVSIMGKRMFDGGERSWPEEAPFHTLVFVLTHQVRSPWERPGGTKFYFVNDAPGSALEQARAVAGDKDIRIAGGANAIVQYLNAGMVDEFTVPVAPVVFGSGTRLFEGADRHRFAFKVADTMGSPLVSHLRYVRA
jgi:dihydrofolate reductase